MAEGPGAGVWMEESGGGEQEGGTRTPQVRGRCEARVGARRVGSRVPPLCWAGPGELGRELVAFVLQPLTFTDGRRAAPPAYCISPD